MSHETVGRVSPRHSPQSRHTPFHRRHSVAPCSDVAGHRLCPRGEEPRRSRPGRFAVPGWPDGCPGSPDEHCPWRPHRGRQGGSAAVSDRDLDRAAAAASATNALGMDAGRCPSPGSRRLRNPTGVSLRLQATQSGHYVQLRTLPVQLRTPDPPHGFCHNSVPGSPRGSVGYRTRTPTPPAPSGRRAAASHLADSHPPAHRRSSKARPLSPASGSSSSVVSPPSTMSRLPAQTAEPGCAAALSGWGTTAQCCAASSYR